MSLLVVEGLSKSFAGLRALNAVSFEVRSGEVLGLMGANGAGKTTLFGVIAGNLAPSAGTVTFDGVQVTGSRPDRICKLGVARTFQIVRPFAGLSVRENVETALLFGSEDVPGPAALAARADEILTELRLAGQADKPASALTLSDRKRLEVARALGTRPKLLLLDEVMAGLTPTEVEDMMETLRQVRRANALTVIIVEHVVRALVGLSERLIVLHHGELIADGAPAEIAASPEVRRVYFGEDDT